MLFRTGSVFLSPTIHQHRNIATAVSLPPATAATTSHNINHVHTSPRLSLQQWSQTTEEVEHSDGTQQKTVSGCHEETVRHFHCSRHLRSVRQGRHGPGPSQDHCQGYPGHGQQQQVGGEEHRDVIVRLIIF